MRDYTGTYWKYVPKGREYGFYYYAKEKQKNSPRYNCNYVIPELNEIFWSGVHQNEFSSELIEINEQEFKQALVKTKLRGENASR